VFTEDDGVGLGLGLGLDGVLVSGFKLPVFADLFDFVGWQFFELGFKFLNGVEWGDVYVVVESCSMVSPYWC